MNPIENMGPRWRRLSRGGLTDPPTEMNYGRPSKRNGPISICLTSAVWCFPCADDAAPSWMQQGIIRLIDFFVYFMKNGIKVYWNLRPKNIFVSSFSLFHFFVITWVFLSFPFFKGRRKCDFYFSTFCRKNIVISLIIYRYSLFLCQNVRNWITFLMIHNIV